MESSLKSNDTIRTPQPSSIAIFNLVMELTSTDLLTYGLISCILLALGFLSGILMAVAAMRAPHPNLFLHKLKKLLGLTSYQLYTICDHAPQTPEEKKKNKKSNDHGDGTESAEDDFMYIPTK
ncbi:hypothetical protein [Murid betaherpesvirus 1]|uniref:M119.2 protein n=4 Tax=Muromegalovirus muridbeta1 TaxID=3050323 RepID=H2A2V8_MUHVS|nr:hypothetical protein QKG64_gp105 [Murid betaherpesvirus 1]YP_214117.1 hypothetical protein MuHV1_gp108 [Murid betaherpesvirus 1]CAP08154.1 m119.2 protein [Murine cytomegalovirus (strain K181)]ADD10483.1 hypothetical protein [Murid betaherpesvirus 1]AQQ81381.1 m119.2 protein [Murid betaherpesvirus 1]WEG71766.1 protein m119.2 [Murid betaherpesvirus 1]CAJ1013331.1 m119.2 protein [Murid betaherpesvirus 1]